MDIVSVMKVKRIKFRQIDEVKAKQKAYTKEYNSRPEVKAKIKAYSSSPEVKARAKARREQPEEKARLKELSLIRREKKKLSKPLPENKVRQDTELVMQQLNRGFISSTRRKKVVEIEGKPSHAEKRTFLTYEEEEEIQRPYRIIREKKKLERAEKRRLKALAEGTTEKNRAI